MGTVLAMFFRCFVCNIPARGTLLPCVTDGIFNAVHYPGFSVVIAAFFEAFREAHEAFSLFQDSKGFSVLQKIFLFSIHFPFILNIIYWIIKIIPNTIKNETVRISNKSTIIIDFHPFLVRRRCILDKPL